MIRARIRSLTSLSFWIVIVAVSVLPACSSRPDKLYPGPLKVTQNQQLEPREKVVEAEFTDYLQNNLDSTINAYHDLYGKIVDTDNVREFSHTYAPSGPDKDDIENRRARTKWSAAVQEPSSALAKEMYRRALEVRQVVVFTAGGAGSGKSSAAKTMPNIVSLIQTAEIVYDTTLSSFDSSVPKIDQALKTHRVVHILYVYRDPIKAFTEGALPRAESNGRTLSIEAFATTHIEAPLVLLRLADYYKGNPYVIFDVVNNELGLNKAAPASLPFVQAIANKYSKDTLVQRLREELKAEYDNGRISADVHDAFLASHQALNDDDDGDLSAP
jgi:hypothetical protein